MDIFTFELETALAAEGCPLCRVEALDEQRWMETFVREGHRDAGVRRRFVASRGFCPPHAGLFLEIARKCEALPVVSAAYVRLIDEDLARLQGITRRVRGSRWRMVRARRQPGGCPACRARERSAERKRFFFCEALADVSFRSRYAASSGLCALHFSGAIKEASRHYPAVTELLLDDWLRRLTALRSGLSEFERKRDHRYRHEPRGREQQAPIEALRHYAGTTWPPMALPIRGDTPGR